MLRFTRPIMIATSPLALDVADKSGGTGTKGFNTRVHDAAIKMAEQLDDVELAQSVTDIERAKEVTERGPFKLFLRLLDILGPDGLASMPVVGTTEGEIPENMLADRYEVPNDTNRKKYGSYYADLYGAVPWGKVRITTRDNIAKAVNKAADAPEHLAVKNDEELSAMYERAKMAVNNGLNALKRAVTFYHKFADAENYTPKAFKVDFVKVDMLKDGKPVTDKDGNVVQMVTEAPNCIYVQKLNADGSPVQGKYKTYTVGRFIGLSVERAILKGNGVATYETFITSAGNGAVGAGQGGGENAPEAFTIPDLGKMDLRAFVKVMQGQLHFFDDDDRMAFLNEALSPKHGDKNEELIVEIADTARGWLRLYETVKERAIAIDLKNTANAEAAAKVANDGRK